MAFRALPSHLRAGGIVSSSNQPGRFITFEGGEGAGKTTQIEFLEHWLKARRVSVLRTREPGGSPFAEQVRALLLSPQFKLDSTAQLFLFSAARRDHVVNVIRPALAAGSWVLCDRFSDSTRAYQGAAGEVQAALIDVCVTHATDGISPDLTILLDLPPKEGLARAHLRRGKAQSADAFEDKAIHYHQAVRAGFLDIARRDPDRFLVLDAKQDSASLANAIAGRVQRMMTSA
jgi:dTMP kinase